jgi:hypothetical protein
MFEKRIAVDPFAPVPNLRGTSAAVTTHPIAIENILENASNDPYSQLLA